MRNVINLDAGAGFINIEKKAGANTIIIIYKNISGQNIYIELYRGNKFYINLACRITENEAAATISNEIFNGNNLHFRIIQDGVPGQFFHIVCDPNKIFNFNNFNLVVFSNMKKIQDGYFIIGSEYNKYNDLNKFTQEQLENFTFKTLREGQL